MLVFFSKSSSSLFNKVSLRKNVRYLQTWNFTLKTEIYLRRLQTLIYLLWTPNYIYWELLMKYSGLAGSGGNPLLFAMLEEGGTIWHSGTTWPGEAGLDERPRTPPPVAEAFLVPFAAEWCCQWTDFLEELSLPNMRPISTSFWKWPILFTFQQLFW